MEGWSGKIKYGDHGDRLRDYYDTHPTGGGDDIMRGPTDERISDSKKREAEHIQGEQERLEAALTGFENEEKRRKAVNAAVRRVLNDTERYIFKARHLAKKPSR